MTTPNFVPDSLWKGKFVILTIGEEILKFPIQSLEHYFRLKRLRDINSTIIKELTKHGN